MADDKTTRAPRDAFLIGLEDDYEIEYWAKRFRVSKERLVEAVTAVGNSAANVGAYLNEDAVAHG